MTSKTYRGSEPQWLDTPQESSGPDWFGMIRRRKWLLLLAAVVGAGLGHLHFLRQPAVYATSGQILVVRERLGDLPIQGAGGSGGYEENLATQALLIRSPLVVAQAVETHKLNDLTSLANLPDPAAAVRGGLVVKTPEWGVDVLDLSFRGSDPEDCKTILTAVMATYISFLGDSQQAVSEETVQIVAKAKDSLVVQLQEKEKAYQEFLVQSPLIWTSEDTTNIHQQRLANIEAARSELQIQISETTSLLEALESAVRTGGEREALLLMLKKNREASGAETEFSSTTSVLLPLLLEEQTLSRTVGPNHPDLKDVRERIRFIREYAQPAPQKDGDKEGSQPVDFFNVYLESLRQQLLVDEQSLKKLDELFQSEREDARSMTVYEVRERIMRNDIKRIQQLFDGVMKRLDEINLVKSYSGFKAQVIAAADRAWQAAPSYSGILLNGTMLGFCCGFMLGFLMEFADKSFGGSQEIREVMGVPVIGQVEVIPRRRKVSSDARLDGTLCVYHAPESGAAEAFRVIRTALMFNVGGENHKVFQITSPRQGDGKSTLAANLAISMANAGKNVLLIDGDFYRPSVHSLFADVDNSTDIASVLNGDAELQDAIQPSVVENLYIAASCPPVANPERLLLSDRFSDLLSVVREQYDFVLFDSPPILASSDSSVISAAVDGIVLVIDAATPRRLATDTATRLVDVGANLVGVVVNRAGANGKYSQNSYRYGAYRSERGTSDRSRRIAAPASVHVEAHVS